MIGIPEQAAGAGDAGAGDAGAGDAGAGGWWWVLVAIVVISGVGAGISFLLLGAARQNQTCARSAQSNSWKGIQISGLPSALQASFGYGRGTQIIESTLNATAQKGVTLPASIAVFAEPLITSDGTQIIPSLSNTSSPRAQRGISAVATLIASSSTYQLEVCINVPSAAAGSYSSQLLFPGATLTAGTSLPVTVTFQSEVVPFILLVGIAPLVLLGILYTTLILIRRNTPNIGLNGLAGQLQKALWSINGIFALILSTGAVFTAWNAQCYRNPTWGSPWPTILVTLVTMVGASAAASTVPMSLAKETG